MMTSTKQRCMVNMAILRKNWRTPKDQVMDTKIEAALKTDHLCDISMTGRKTGKTYRFEIWFHYTDGQLYLTGKPAPRQWLENMKVNPEIVFHLKESVQQDIPAIAIPITDLIERRAILTKLLQGSDYFSNLEKWTEGSPLVRIELHPLSIRPFQPSPEEYAAVVAVHNAAWPDERQYTGEDWQQNDAEWPSRALNQRFVVEHEGAIVGECMVYQAYWHSQPDVAHISFSVQPDYEGRGVEALLFEQLVAHAQQHINPFTALAADVREDKLDRVQFLVQRGFQPTLRELRSALQVDGFDSTAYQPLIASFGARHIGLYPLNELQPRDPNWKENLYELRMAIVQDVPSVEPPSRITMAEFENQIFGDPAFTPEAWFIAIDESQAREGKIGPYMGQSNLWVNDPAYRRLDTGLTGVVRGYRRLGLATALKVMTIEFAKQHNCPLIVTSNGENHPMYQINHRLGFRPIAAWVAYRKAL